MADGHSISQPGPVAAPLGGVVVVGQVHGGNGLLAGVRQGGQVSLQYIQQAQGEVLHAVHLHAGLQKPAGLPGGSRDDLVHNLRGIIHSIALPEPILGDKLLHGGDAAIDAPALLQTVSGIDIGDNLLRHRLVLGTEAAAGLEVGGVSQDKVHIRVPGQVLIHVKAGGEGVGNRCQHHRQRQGNDRHHGFPPAPAQVGPGHARKGRAAPGFADLLPLPRLFRPAALGVAHGLHRGDLRRHAARTGAGEEHGQQGEQRRSNENQGVEGDEGVLVAQLGHDDRGELVADDKAQEQSNGDADKAEKQGLLPDDAFDLLAGGADGFQKAVKPDIVGDGNLEDVVDNQVAGEDNQQQQNHNGDQRGDVKAVGKLGPGVAPVDADFQVILPLGVVVLIAVVLQDLKDVLLDLEVAFEHHVQVPFSGHGVGVPAALGT